MKAMILAAGLGTRLKPWTLEHPKALVPVDGVPMLERVIFRIREQGFDYIVVNVHHFASQIIEFLCSKNFGVKIVISDESGELLDTGGGILNAKDLLLVDNSPFLVHNVDILSTANLLQLMAAHKHENYATLLVSQRNSTRRLIFDKENRLMAWNSIIENRFIPADFTLSSSDSSYSFSGIYVMSPSSFDAMAREGFTGRFPIMDFFLRNVGNGKIRSFVDEHLELIDIGKPETLSRANESLLSN